MKEKRKHVNHMSHKEYDALIDIVDINTFSFTKHCLEKLTKRNISRKQVIKTIRVGDIVEYHFKGNTHRLLLRGRPNNDRKCVCVVLDITTKEIVTTYFNHCDDRHSTLNFSIYDRKLDVLKMLRGKRGKNIRDINHIRDSV